jgi:uncharacterized membrane protein
MTHKGTIYWVKLMEFFHKHWGCHQMATRSFFYNGYQFPVCARCTGIIIGYIAEIAFLLANLRFDFLTAIIFITPTALDGTIQYLKKHESTNMKRLLTGILAGIGALSILANIITILISFFRQC